jgi:two-component system NtrC family sensor kinase
VDAIRVLYVEDDPSERALTRRHLERHAPHVRLTEVRTVEEALERLEIGDVDLVLSDYRLPDGTGLDVLEAVKAKGLPAPVVLVTGSGDVDAAVHLLKAGAADYIVKRPDYVATLPRVLEGARRWFQSARELRQTPVLVLYAEHDPADVELVARAFRAHGPHLRLEVATRGREALARLKAAPYDLLLLDYRMPDLSGIEVLKALREEGIRVPVVMVTGQGDEETAVQVFKLGVADYIVKREGYLTKLPSTLENVLAQHRLADEKEALVVLNGLAKSLVTFHDQSDLAHRITRAARDLLRADVSVLWFLEGDELRPVVWVGIGESVAESLRFRVAERARDPAPAERLVALPELSAEPDRSRARAALGAVEHHRAVTLPSPQGIAGVLAVASQRPRVFTAVEERLLIALGDYAAIALENARLYQQVRDQFEDLRRAQSHLVQTEKLATMGALLAGVAHELNNPLAVVMGRAALLHQKLGGGLLGADTEKLAQAARRCARIVRSFLALARHRPPERQRASLNQIVHEAVELLAYPLRTDNVEVTLGLAEDLPMLWADPDQLHQVVVNLIANAHQAMCETLPPRRLTITSRYESETRRVSLEVADTGPGIPPEIQARTFEPFFTTKPPGQGTGLGLSLCQGLVEGHGGSIRVDSQPGQGAVFVVELPVQAPPIAAPEARAAETTAPIQGKRILVVDDEPEVAAVLSDMLSADGHEVETAENGAVALDKLRGRAYDLILCDLRMPELDGPGLYQELQRRDPQLCRRIIFLTGDVLSPRITEFLERTAAPKLGKPFALEEMRQVVQSALRADPGR